MAIYSAADPVGSQNFFAANGLQISNDTTTPNSLIDVGAGITMDSTLSFVMNLGNFFGAIPLPANPNTVTTVSTATVGTQGLDAGTVAASTMYYIYVIGDQTGKKQSSVVLSTNVTAPGLPAGYNIYRRIGSRPTNSGGNLVKAYDYGLESNRTTFYDAALATAITAGHAVAFTNVNLTGLVPAINNVIVWLYVSYVPATAGNVLSLQPGTATGNGAVVTGQVATVASTQLVPVMAQLVTLGGIPSPVINYKVGNAGDSVAISVAGYQYTL